MTILMTDDLSEGETLLRFHEDPHVWGVSFMGGASPLSANGYAGDYPGWLAHIVAVGKAGRHEMRPISPPPRVILWFVVDPELHLVRFQDMKGTP